MIINKKNLFSGIGTLMILFASIGVARAATNTVVFDPGAGTLSVSGSCSARYVMVIIRRTSDNAIWGSSNPECVDRSYQYKVDISDTDRTGETFTVQTFDETSAGGVAPNASGTPKVNAPVQTVVFSEASLPTTAITMDTSSLSTAPDDQTFLDSVLSQFFGIVANVNDAVQNFGTIIANTVKTSLVATINLFSKNITVLPGGSISVPRGANQLAGSDWLGAGAMDVFIPNISVTSSSQIIITPTSPTDITLSVTQKNDGTGFHVGALRPPSAPISFDWLIVQTYGAAVPAQSQQTSAGTPAPAPAVTAPPTPSFDASSSDATSTDISTDTSVISTSTITIATTTQDAGADASTTAPDAATSTGN